MKQLPTYADSRLSAFCAFCGGGTETRDHCPSKVLLDEPLPDNLPVVPACLPCNASFSTDEEYLACLISCVRAGSSEPQLQSRPKASRILAEKPVLRARLASARTAGSGFVSFMPEDDRVRNVILKLARGHALFEFNELYVHEPEFVLCQPMPLLDAMQRREFDSPEIAPVWPEVGSRAMQRLILQSSELKAGWIEVQPNLYRYHVSLFDGINVRIAIQEYLACWVRWQS